MTATRGERTFSTRATWPSTEGPYGALLRRLGERPNLIDLTVSNPTKCEIEALSAPFENLGDPSSARYEPTSRGQSAAREAIAAHDELASPERVVLTASSSEAYGWLFKLLADPGDEVLVPTPSYPLLGFLAQLESVRLRTYPLIRSDGYAVDMGALRDAITDRTRAIIAVSPNNPTGTFLSAPDRDALEEAAEQHGLALICDEVFREYPWPGGPTPARFAGRQRVLSFTLSGLSKLIGAPQLKLGWMLVDGPPSAVARAMARLDVIADTYLSVNTPVQLALPRLLNDRPGRRAAIQARVLGNLATLDDAIARLGAGALVEREAAEGGWYAILRGPLTRTAEAWSERLALEEDVLVQPGFLYDIPHEATFVVSLLSRPDRFEAAIRRVVRCLNRG